MLLLNRWDLVLSSEPGIVLTLQEYVSEMWIVSDQTECTLNSLPRTMLQLPVMRNGVQNAQDGDVWALTLALIRIRGRMQFLTRGTPT